MSNITDRMDLIIEYFEVNGRYEESKRIQDLYAKAVTEIERFSLVRDTERKQKMECLLLSGVQL